MMENKNRPGRIESAIRAFAWRMSPTHGYDVIPYGSLPDVQRIDDSIFSQETIERLVTRLTPCPICINDIHDVKAFIAHIMINVMPTGYHPETRFENYLHSGGLPLYTSERCVELAQLSDQCNHVVGAEVVYNLCTRLLWEIHIL